MANSVVAIYKLDIAKPIMIVVDAENLEDPSFNPEGCIQISLDIEVYNQIQSNSELMDWIQSLADDLLIPADPPEDPPGES